MRYISVFLRHFLLPPPPPALPSYRTPPQLSEVFCPPSVGIGIHSEVPPTYHFSGLPLFGGSPCFGAHPSFSARLDERLPSSCTFVEGPTFFLPPPGTPPAKLHLFSFCGRKLGLSWFDPLLVPSSEEPLDLGFDIFSDQFPEMERFPLSRSFSPLFSMVCFFPPERPPRKIDPPFFSGAFRVVFF